MRPALSNPGPSRARPLIGAALLALGLSLAACVPSVATHGFVPDPEGLDQIQPGVSTRDEVRGLLGTPTSQATVDDRRWYYLTRVTENLAFLDPEFRGGSLIVIDFDEQGRVSDVERRALDAGEKVAFVTRETPTQGKNLGLLEQLFGNIGRFQRGQGQGGGGGRRGPPGG